VSRQTISTITDKVVEGMTEWQNRTAGRGSRRACSPEFACDSGHEKEVLRLTALTGLATDGHGCAETFVLRLGGARN
jgi:hypothetical protein